MTDLIDFKPNPACAYRFDYVGIFGKMARNEVPSDAMLRSLVLNDLWFILYFVMKIEAANHPFVVQACKDVEFGPKNQTLDLWAREHFKSTIITTAEVVQKILRNPEERIGIFSHTRPVAKGFLRSIKLLFEGSELLKQLFPDILYNNPSTEAAKWSEDDGLILKRKSFAKEATLEAWGLLEGMPTGKHFTHIVYDDVETADVVENPDTVKKLIDRFDLSQNLGTAEGTYRVVGTTYAHNGLLTYIRAKKDIHGRLIYRTRIKPATDDGTPSGKPVLLSQSKIDMLKANEYVFNCQQLLDPTPVGVRKLDSNLLHIIDPEFIPRDVFKFMAVDAAGDSKDGGGDAWAIGVFGVEPDMNDIGASKIYLMDLVVSPMRQTEAIEEIVRMYLRNGMIMQLGVEKVGISTTELHVTNALQAKGRSLSINNKSLALLRPAGRNKIRRIESALAWPLYNGKLYISTDIPAVYIGRLKDEMDKFPFWHDDGLDMMAYLYDMLKDFRFLPYLQQNNDEDEGVLMLHQHRNPITGY